MMKKRYIIGAALVALLLAGVSIYAFMNKDADKQTKPDPDQIAANSAEKKDRSKSAEKGQDQSAGGLLRGAIEKTKRVFASDNKRVVALGDSLTQGVGDSTNSGGYVGLLDKKVNEGKDAVQFDNFGHAGDRTDQLYKKIQDPKVSSAIRDADLVLITIGANDIMKVLKENVTDLKYEDFVSARDQYKKRLEHVFKELQALNPKAEIYLLGFYNPFGQYFHDIPELNEIVHTWNDTSKKTTKEFKQVHYIPTADLFDKSTQNLFYEDNFHPNNKGYQKIATRVLEYIEMK